MTDFLMKLLDKDPLAVGIIIGLCFNEIKYVIIKLSKKKNDNIKND